MNLVLYFVLNTLLYYYITTENYGTMDNRIKCMGCNSKYINDDEHIKCDFDYNRLGDRNKSCVKCRNRNKTNREKHNPMAQDNTNKITPTIHTNLSKCEIIVYYTMDYKQQQTSFRYKRCGMDKAMDKANEYLIKLHETHTNKFTDDAIYKVYNKDT